MFTTPHIAINDTVVNERNGKKGTVVAVDYLHQSATIVWLHGFFKHHLKFIEFHKLGAI